MRLLQFLLSGQILSFFAIILFSNSMLEMADFELSNFLKNIFVNSCPP